MKVKKYLYIFFLIAFIVLPKNTYACGTCYPTAVTLSVSPDPVGPGQNVQFTVQTIDQGSTCVGDSLGAGVTCSSCFICDPVCHIDLRSSTDCNGTATCTAPSATGTYSFLHRWENIERLETCGDCPPCTRIINYTVDANAPPPPIPGIPSGLLCDSDTGIETAIGCIPVTNTTDFAGFLIRWGFGISGGIAFILIIVAGFQIITSGGFPDKVQAGKQLLTAAISGLLLIIFSVFILELFGVRILKLPGF